MKQNTLNFQTMKTTNRIKHLLGAGLLTYLNTLITIGLLVFCESSYAQVIVTWTNGHSYQAVFSDNPTWFQARDAAAAMTLNGTAGYLATFVTRDEQEFVISQLGGGPNLNALWLGGFQDISDPGYAEPNGAWK